MIMITDLQQCRNIGKLKQIINIEDSISDHVSLKAIGIIDKPLNKNDRLAPFVSQSVKVVVGTSLMTILFLKTIG